MCKIIQMIVTSETNSLFLIDFDMKTSELTFRTSIVPEYLQKEKIQRGEKGMLHTNLYFFQEGYLSKFVIENEIAE